MAEVGDVEDNLKGIEFYSKSQSPPETPAKLHRRAGWDLIGYQWFPDALKPGLGHGDILTDLHRIQVPLS